MTSRLTVKTKSLSFLFVLLFACSLTKAQINVVYKDKKADTLKLFENKKVMIEQLSQKEAQNSIQIDKIDQYTKTLAKANDSLANGLNRLKKEVEALSKPAAVVPILPEVHPAVLKPATPLKPVFNVQPAPLPNVVPVYITSYLNLKLDSIKAVNEKLNERITNLQEAVSQLKAMPIVGPAPECSHTLIYIFLGLLALGLLYLLFSRNPKN